MITQFCNERGICPAKLFREAYDQEQGIVYPLQAPERLAELWERGLCEPPLYLLRHIRRLLQAEETEEQVPMIFV